MGHFLETFICKQEDASILTNHFDKAVKIDLDQGICLVPMTDELFDQINNSTKSNSVYTFQYLTDNIETIILKLIDNKKMAYVEAEYFGGEGGQSAVIWENNKRSKFLKFGQGKINQVLKDFGVIAENRQDEFITLGFGMRRMTNDWLENPD